MVSPVTGIYDGTSSFLSAYTYLRMDWYIRRSSTTSVTTHNRGGWTRITRILAGCPLDIHDSYCNHSPYLRFHHN